MLYCPNCGIIVKNNENFCLNCGEKIPDNIQERFKQTKRFNRYWFIPLTVLLLFLMSTVSFYLFLHHQTTQAKELYELGEQKVLNEEYETAKDYFQEALSYRDNFHEAKISLQFVNQVLEINENLADVSSYLDTLKFQEALNLVNEAENALKNYHGQAVTEFIQHILMQRNKINIASIKNELTNRPSIDTLKNLLSEAEAIQSDKAEEITEYIHDEIVDYTFAKASAKLNDKQFNDAKLLIEDGLTYVTQSEKLQSLRSTIDKEKHAFEMDEQKRIEQAIDRAEEEREHNEQDAVTLKKVKLDKDDQNRFTVKGKVISKATIPVHSIYVEYSLTSEDVELLDNKVYVYPETLYPDETGKFEFTHYEDAEDLDDIKIQVNNIKWYTD